MSSQELQRTVRLVATMLAGGCLPVCILLGLVAAVMIYFVSQNSPSGWISLSTPYPIYTLDSVAASSITHTPYPTSIPNPTATVTLTPYRTATPSPTAAPRPESGFLHSGWDVDASFSICKIVVRNQYVARDAVVILTPAHGSMPLETIYVRAGDVFTGYTIQNGIFSTYITHGLDWDSTARRFKTDAVYLRLPEQQTFDHCNQYGLDLSNHITYTVVLNAEPGEGQQSGVPVPASEFPVLPSLELPRVSRTPP